MRATRVRVALNVRRSHETTSPEAQHPGDRAAPPPPARSDRDSVSAQQRVLGRGHGNQACRPGAGGTRPRPGRGACRSRPKATVCSSHEAMSAVVPWGRYACSSSNGRQKWPIWVCASMKPGATQRPRGIDDPGFIAAGVVRAGDRRNRSRPCAYGHLHALQHLAAVHVDQPPSGHHEVGLHFAEAGAVSNVGSLYWSLLMVLVSVSRA